MEEVRKYCAFISYRHKELDKNIAKQIHSKIERYTVPREMRETWGGKKLGKVFRDEEELPVSSNLSDSIYQALDNSDYLIVICSPDTPESLWVEREITYFIEHHGRDHVVAVLANGTPETSFPKALTTVTDENGNVIDTIEPLAANLTGVNHEHSTGRLNKEIVRLYAAIMGCPFDALWQREKRQRLHRILALVSILAAVAIGYGVVIFVNYQKIQEKNDQITAQNQELISQDEEIKKQYAYIKEQSDEIARNNIELFNQKTEIENQKNSLAELNEEITAKNKELEIGESEALLNNGRLLYEKGDMKSAIGQALAAMANPEGRNEFADEGENLLSDAMGARSYENVMRTVAVLEQDSAVESMLLSKDNRYVFTVDSKGDIRCFDIADGKLKWHNKTDTKYHSYTIVRQRMVELDKYGILLNCADDRISAFSIETGNAVWSYNCKTTYYTDFQAISKDQNKIALIDNTDIIDKNFNIVVLNTVDGTIEKTIPVGDAFGGADLKAEGSFAGAFSDDGNTLFGMIYDMEVSIAYKGYFVFSVNLDSGEISIIKKNAFEKTQNTFSYPSFVIGMDYDNDNNMLTVIHYNSDEKKMQLDEYLADKEYLDGQVESGYEFIWDIPNRESYGAYRISSKRDEELLLFTCESVAAAYDLEKRKFTYIDKDSGISVLDLSCINHELKVYAGLMQDGCMSVNWLVHGGMAEALFADKAPIMWLDISDKYAINEREVSGLRLQDDAVEVIVTSAEPKKIYILRPDKDPECEQVDWYTPSEFSRTSGAYTTLEYIGNGQLALSENVNDHGAYIKIVDAQTGEIVYNYNIGDDEEANGLAICTVGESKIWPDRKHLTYGSNSGFNGIINLETLEKEQIFGKAFVMGLDYSDINNGEVLHAAICQKENNAVSDPNFEIKWRICDGEIHTVQNPSELQLVSGDTLLTKEGVVFVGKSGNIIIPLFVDDDGNVGSVLAVKTKDDSVNVIELKENGSFALFDTSRDSYEDMKIAIGVGKPVFATVCPGGELVKTSIFTLYDIDKGEALSSFSIPEDIRDIFAVKFIQDDSKVIIWTRDRRVYIYDAETGEKLYEEVMQYERKGINYDVELFMAEDTERNRLFLYTSGSAAMCISTLTWEKQSEFFGFDAFCPETNEIYKIKNSQTVFKEDENAVLKVKAYTLDDLIEKAKSGNYVK